MRFWDSSAVLPLLWYEASTGDMAALVAGDPALVVWHWTAVECTSSLERRRREGMPPADLALAARRLAALRSVWTEVTDHEAVRIRAERCLRLHPLRAADSGQLAAALVYVERGGALLPFVTLDGRLAEAATKEGFEVLGAAAY